PATVDVVVGDPLASGATRLVLPPGGCARAPDGSCLNRPGIMPLTCGQMGPEGICVGSASAVAPPTSAPPAAPAPAGQSPGYCTQVDSSNRCLAYSNTVGGVPSTITLRAELNGQMAMLAWTGISGAMT